MTLKNQPTFKTQLILIRLTKIFESSQIYVNVDLNSVSLLMPFSHLVLFEMEIQQNDLANFNPPI